MHGKFITLPLSPDARGVLLAVASPTAQRLLQLIREAGPAGITSKDLEEETGKSQAQVSRLLREMETLRMLRRQRVKPTGRGRPEERWRISRSRAWSLLTAAEDLAARRNPAHPS